MALSRDGSLLVFVSPEETRQCHALRAAHRLLQRHASARHAGRELPFWSPITPTLDFRERKLQKIAIAAARRRSFHRIGRTRRRWGSKGAIIYTPDAEGSIQRINADGSECGRYPKH